jgi:hypothetical protein
MRDEKASPGNLLGSLYVATLLLSCSFRCCSLPMTKAGKRTCYRHGDFKKKRFIEMSEVPCTADAIQSGRTTRIARRNGSYESRG